MIFFFIFTQRMHDLRPKEKTFYEMKIYFELYFEYGCFYVKDCNILVSQIGFLQAAWRSFGKLCCAHVIQSGIINYMLCCAFENSYAGKSYSNFTKRIFYLIFIIQIIAPLSGTFVVRAMRISLKL